MTVKILLLEFMQVRMGFSYLSGLQFLPNCERMRLARVLADIPVVSATLRKWNDALMYLSNGPPEQTAEAACERLNQSSSQLR